VSTATLMPAPPHPWKVTYNDRVLINLYVATLFSIYVNKDPNEAYLGVRRMIARLREIADDWLV
jgi:hypothetical protein